jgi:transposase
VLSEEEFMDAKSLHRQGVSYSEIGRLLGRDPRTVKRYVEADEQPRYHRAAAASMLDPFKPIIDGWLCRTPPSQAKRIHQDLVRDYGFAGSYQTVRRYVELTLPRSPREPEERFETAPGAQAQVDWSHEEPLKTSSGIELPLYAFHMVLGHSRDAFVRFCGSQDLVTFWACHRAAFAHFGGVPHEILYDRTKTVVRRHVGLTRGLDTELYHPEALASATHYGFSLRLCLPGHAKTKGKVEADVRWLRGRLCAAHSWSGYEQANAAWVPWNEEVARPRVHGTHGEVVAQRALRDRAALLELPSRPYLVVARTSRRVARDGFISFEGRRYLVPKALPGERLEITIGEAELEIRRDGERQLLAYHRRGAPRRLLPDPEGGSVSLAELMAALPSTPVHARPLALYEELSRV